MNNSSLAHRAYAQVALNPGAAPTDTDYYNLADILLTAENFYADFRCVSGLCPDC